jgi:hypothetical protein
MGQRTDSVVQRRRPITLASAGAPDREVKWITCAGFDDQKVVHDSARSCSTRCRNRVWRRRHGIPPAEWRLASCAWCASPLLYMPQDRLPNARPYCDDKCARQAWLGARARKFMTATKALDIAIRRLRKSRMPTVLAAAFTLRIYARTCWTARKPTAGLGSQPFCPSCPVPPDTSLVASGRSSLVASRSSVACLPFQCALAREHGRPSAVSCSPTPTQHTTALRH